MLQADRDDLRETVEQVIQESPVLRDLEPDLARVAVLVEADFHVDRQHADAGIDPELATRRASLVRGGVTQR